MTEDGRPPGVPADGRLVDLAEAACRELMELLTVGRLVWHGREGLTVAPVNYVVDGRDVLVRVAPYSLAARECDDVEVAFEVDEIDHRRRRGWSVLARGRAHREPLPPLGADTPRPDAWPAGTRTLGLRIEVVRLTGRHLDTAGPSIS